MPSDSDRLRSPALRLLLTAGPTYEPIDAVRFIGNRSSGRMGLAIASAAANRGLAVTLVLGPIALPAPEHPGINVLRFRSVADLQAVLVEQWPNHDVLIMAAAVGDYRLKEIEPAGPASKLERRAEGLVLHLEPTPDLLASLASITRADQRVIGFALEPVERLETSARGKLQRKSLDAIVANPLETMDSEHVTASVFTRDGGQVSAPAGLSKSEFGAWLVDRLATICGPLN